MENSGGMDHTSGTGGVMGNTCGIDAVGTGAGGTGASRMDASGICGIMGMRHMGG